MIKLSISFLILTATTLYVGGGCKIDGIVHMCPDPPKSFHDPVSDHQDWWGEEGKWGPCMYLARSRFVGSTKYIQFGDGSKIYMHRFARDKAKCLKVYQKSYYDSFAKKLKYTINEKIRLRSSTNLELFIRHYEREAEKANVEIKITRMSRYAYTIEGHEDLPKPRVKWSNPFDKMIEGRIKSEMKEGYNRISLATEQAMRGKRRNEIASAIEQAWEEHLSAEKNLISYYGLAHKELDEKRKVQEEKVRKEKEKEKIARKKMLANKTASQKEDALKKASIRTFTNKFGAEIKGQLVGVAYLKKAVVLRCSKNERLYVPISSFSESDLNYIKNWWAENS